MLLSQNKNFKKLQQSFELANLIGYTFHAQTHTHEVVLPEPLQICFETETTEVDFLSLEVRLLGETLWQMNETEQGWAFASHRDCFAQKTIYASFDQLLIDLISDLVKTKIADFLDYLNPQTAEEPLAN